MKKSIVSYYNTKFEDIPEITFDESFNFQPDKNKIIRVGIQRCAIAASIVIIVFSFYLIEKESSFSLNLEISNAAQTEESTINDESSDQSVSANFEGSKEVANIIDLYVQATERASLLEADLSEVIRALDKYENTVNIEDMIDADKYIVWVFRGNISINEGDFQQAIQYFENLLTLDTLSQERKVSSQRTINQLTAILERQANQ
tara:strand:- start:353 stop:964 length:612 start_codon:yes stop_codon:yes gene_type:complete